MNNFIGTKKVNLGFLPTSTNLPCEVSGFAEKEDGPGLTKGKKGVRKAKNAFFFRLLSTHTKGL